MDGEQSIAAALQIFSDKFQTFLKAGALVSFALQTTALHFVEDTKRKQVTENKSLLDYLQNTSDAADVSEASSQICFSRNKCTPTNIVQTIQEGVEYTLETLLSLSFSRLLAFSFDGFRLSVHSLLASYIADISDAENILFIKRGNMKNMPFYKCPAVSPESALARSCTKWTYLLSKQFLLHGYGSFLASDMISEHSMLTIPPVLSNVAFMSIHPSVDIYSVLHF